MSNPSEPRPALVTTIKNSLLIVAATLLSSCGGGGGGGNGNSGPPIAPPPPPPPPPAAAFGDVTVASGIAYTNGFVFPLVDPTLEIFTTPGAVAAGDYDNDGDVDLFIVRGDIGPNLLYRNIGGLVFEEVAAAAGVANTMSANQNYRHSGPMFADMDGDADLDLFIGGLEGDPCLIFENNGDGTFSDVTAGSGIDSMGPGNSVGAAFGDYDLDGDLDMFVAHWGTVRDFDNPGDTEHLWRNDSDANGIRFTSVSIPAGISPTILTLPDPLTTLDGFDHTFAPTFARINDDRYPDVLSVADFNFTQYFVNNQDGTFSNATDIDVLIDENGMGNALGDYDNDGDLDWFVSSIFDDGPTPKYGNRLYRNDDGVFADVTDEAGVGRGGWGWGSCFIDVENDGDLDIYHTNGWPLEEEDANYRIDESKLFVSEGDGSFVNRAAEFGLDDNDEGRGVVCADFDNDGDIDILQLITNGATLWQNNASGNNYLGIRLQGLSPNTEATGSRIWATIGSSTQMREVTVASNLSGQNPVEQIFGLGAAAQVDELRIEWPDGAETVLNDVQAGQKLVLQQPTP